MVEVYLMADGQTDLSVRSNGDSNEEKMKMAGFGSSIYTA